MLRVSIVFKELTHHNQVVLPEASSHRTCLGKACMIYLYSCLFRPFPSLYGIRSILRPWFLFSLSLSRILTAGWSDESMVVKGLPVFNILSELWADSLLVRIRISRRRPIHLSRSSLVSAACWGGHGGQRRGWRRKRRRCRVGKAGEGRGGNVE